MQEILPDFSIFPLIFTSLKESDIGEFDISKAKSENIGVVVQDGFNILLDMAKDQKEPDEFITFFENLIRNETGYNANPFG